MQFFRFLLYQLIADFDNMLHSDYNFSTVLYSQCILTSSAISRCQQYVKRLNEKSSKNSEIADERVRFERRREREGGGVVQRTVGIICFFKRRDVLTAYHTYAHIKPSCFHETKHSFSSFAHLCEKHSVIRAQHETLHYK